MDRIPKPRMPPTPGEVTDRVTADTVELAGDLENVVVKGPMDMLKKFGRKAAENVRRFVP